MIQLDHQVLPNCGVVDDPLSIGRIASGTGRRRPQRPRFGGPTTTEVSIVAPPRRRPSHAVAPYGRPMSAKTTPTGVSFSTDLPSTVATASPARTPALSAALP